MRRFRSLSLTSAIAWLVFASLFAIGLYAQAPGLHDHVLTPEYVWRRCEQGRGGTHGGTRPREFHRAAHASWRVLRDGVLRA